MIMRLNCHLLLITILLLVSSLQQCSAFNIFSVPGAEVTSGNDNGVNDNSGGSGAKYTPFFRIGFNKLRTDVDVPSSATSASSTPPSEEDMDKFFSEMLLITFNVCSMLLIFLRCYYHWLSWRRTNRKEVDVLQDMRLKAERKLQDIEQQKWKFYWKSSSNDSNKTVDYRYMYAGQSCPICWQEFQVPTSPQSQLPCSSGNDGKEEPLVASEETHLLFASATKKMVGSDGKPIKSLPCGHAFDHGCAVEWLVTLHKKNMDSPLTCPVCREAF